MTIMRSELSSVRPMRGQNHSDGRPFCQTDRGMTELAASTRSRRCERSNKAWLRHDEVWLVRLVGEGDAGHVHDVEMPVHG